MVERPDDSAGGAGELPDTWAALLAHCVDLARAATALPTDGDGGRWRRAVPHVIAAHAVTLALTELDRIADEERPLALDKAELACREASAALHALWQGESLPAGIAELLHEARVAFEAAANAGVEWCVASERLTVEGAEALAERLRRAGFAGELFIGAPGAELFAGSPCAFARAPGGAPPGEEHAGLIGAALGLKRGLVGEPQRVPMPRQVYRQMDFGTGRVVRDLVLAMNEPLPPGQPMLVLAVEGGRPCALPMAARGPALAQPVPVVFGDGDGDTAA